MLNGLPHQVTSRPRHFPQRNNRPIALPAASSNSKSAQLSNASVRFVASSFFCIFVSRAFLLVRCYSNDIWRRVYGIGTSSTSSHVRCMLFILRALASSSQCGPDKCKSTQRRAYVESSHTQESLVELCSGGETCSHWIENGWERTSNSLKIESREKARHVPLAVRHRQTLQLARQRNFNLEHSQIK